MQILVTKDFTWSHSGRLARYKANQIAEIDSKTAAQMIKAGYAVLAEQKMIDINTHENKMLDIQIDNKSIPAKNKKSKKTKEVDDE